MITFKGFPSKCKRTNLSSHPNYDGKSLKSLFVKSSVLKFFNYDIDSGKEQSLLFFKSKTVKERD